MLRNIGKHHRRDFEFYLRWARRVRVFDPAGGVHTTHSTDQRGERSAMECFVEFETIGRPPYNCRQPRLIREVLRGKRLANLHIKLWAKELKQTEQQFPGTARAIIDNMIAECSEHPEWVWKATARQAGLSGF